MMKRKTAYNLIFIFFLIAISFLTGELLFRFFIFSERSPFKQLKDPGKYAKTSSDDYWKLYYKFGGEYRPPAHPNYLLGWVGFFDNATFMHHETSKLGSRKPVLNYGDSFTMCIDTVQCFEDILNADSAFNKNNFLLNYGVGGYGVDQMYLLFSKTVDKYQNPFIVFSIMPTDMDRCMLSVRTGQKPYFKIYNDSLKLCGVPVDSHPEIFFKNNPIEITSYLWSRLSNSDLNPFYDSNPTDAELRKKLLTLNKKIIFETYSEIKKRNLQYVFVIFDELWNEEGSWRSDSLKHFFSDNNINFIHTRDLVNKDTINFGKYEFNRYIVNGNGHPTTYYNKLLCEELKKYIFNYDVYSLQNQKLQKEKMQLQPFMKK